MIRYIRIRPHERGLLFREGDLADVGALNRLVEGVDAVVHVAAVYRTAGHADGYYRDGCVFREDVNIFDTMSAIVKYSNGATMSYALNAYMPYEGYRVAFNGEKGRLDVQSFERQPWEVADSHEIYVTKSFGKRTKVPRPTSPAMRPRRSASA